jgi:hypothetical protein
MNDAVDETPGSETEAVQETDNTQTTAPEGAFADLLSGIKEGDRQKYTSVEDALKSITPAQEHINRLEAENAELKRKAEEAKTIEELMSKLESETKVDQPVGQTFDESKVAALIEAQLERKQQESVSRQNTEAVMKAFQERYGEKASEAYNQMAQEAGLTSDMLKNLAATSPKVVLKLAGFDSKPSMPGKTESTVRTEGFGASKVLPSAQVKMVGSDTNQLVNAWRATEAIVNQ